MTVGQASATVAAAGVTESQRLLLRAALTRGQASIDAWQTWQGCTSVDALDRDSQWLLPQLYQNLHAQGVSDNRLIRHRSVFLHNWYKNALTLRRAEPAIAALRQAGRRLVLLGGAAMALRHYEALGARSFGPLRVLARPGAMAADATLAPADGALDVVPALLRDDLDEALAGRADTAEWHSLRWPVLSPADQLVDISLDRHTWDTRSRLLWIADVAALGRRPPLDWQRAAALAADAGRMAPFAEAIQAVERLLDVGLPVATLAPAAGVPTP